MRKESWTGQIAEACPFEYVYPFLEHITHLEINSAQVKGSVLVIGQSSAFPEKTLIATPESAFRELREEVETLYCCDTSYPSTPEDYLDIPCINTIFFDQIPDPQPKTAHFEYSSSYTFLPKVKPDFFDTVLMFRVVDLGTQIEEQGLIESVAPHLKKGGYFICSGGRFPVSPRENFYHPLTPVKIVRLPDYSEGYLFTQNTGVVLQKR
jgi:hypothetical protein